MLAERRARALRYDRSTDTATVDVTPLAGGKPSTPARAAVTLLLDAQGFLVGVDLGGEGFDRVVVMLGRHEDVARTLAGRAAVTRSGPEVTSVAIAGARAAIRADEKNPHAP